MTTPNPPLPLNLSISPPTVYLAVKPGESQQHTIILEQLGSETLEVTPSLVDFEADNQTGQPILKDSSSFPYLKFTSTGDAFGRPFVLKPLEKKELSLAIDVPAKAFGGEFPLTLLFSAQTVASGQAVGASQVGGSATTNSQVTGTIGSNLIVTITASEADQGLLEIENIETPRFVDSFAGIKFSILASNSGQNATTASGSATISNWQNQEVTQFEFLPDMILSDTNRLLRTAPNLQTAVSNPEEIASTFTYKPGFLIGPYSIQASLDRNSATPPGTNQSIVSARVVAFPFFLVAVILFILVAFISYKILRRSADE